VIFLALFGILPGVIALVFSFSKFVGGRPQLFAAGLDNYTLAFSDSRFGTAMEHMFSFLLISLPFGVVGVVLLSLLLHARPGWLTAVLRTIYFVPGAVAGPAVVILAIFMFDPNVGPFGLVWRTNGLSTVTQVVRGNRVPLLFTLIGFFAGAGGWIAIFFGALNGISHEIQEAARIDGCDTLRLAWYIKLPLIRPYIAYMAILTFAGNVQLFAEPQLLGRVPGATIGNYWSPNQLSYAFAFEYGNFGAAAALSLVMLAIGLLGALLVLRFTNLFQTDANGN
jgi:multiple sugar transport system permease protein